MDQLMKRFMTNVLREAGFGTPELRKLAVAVSFTESLGHADMYGDTSLADAEWGPSIGLFQIRSRHDHFGTGKERDGSRLEDPVFNAKAALTISNRGTNWNPWSVYKDQSYLKNMEKGDYIVIWPESLLLEARFAELRADLRVMDLQWATVSTALERERQLLDDLIRRVTLTAGDTVNLMKDLTLARTETLTFTDG
jgi:hypothetical protein